MIPYASALPRLSALKDLDKYCLCWRFMLSPASRRSLTWKNKYLLTQRGYALDNGVYADWKNGKEWNEKSFVRILEEYGRYADFIVAPDVVGNWDETVMLFMIWVNRLWQYHTTIMIVAQDGCERNDFSEIRALCLNHQRFLIGFGVFIGGTTDWKLEYAKKIGEICHEFCVRCHLGRVNSALRTRFAHHCKCTSFDGSGMSRYSNTASVVSAETYRINHSIYLF